MRILQINKYSTLNGGSEVVADIVGRAGYRFGHEVALVGFHKEGQPEVFGARSLGPEKLGVRGMFRDSDLVERVVEIAREFRPDAFLHHNVYHHFPMNQLVTTLGKMFRVPQSIILHDHKAVCAVYTGLRDGKPCHECERAGYRQAVRYRCKDGSAVKSAVVAMDSVWNAKLGRVYHRFANIVCPSRFLARNVQGIGGGRRIQVLSNPCPDPQPGSEVRTGIAFASRLSEEKGVDVLLALAGALPEIPFHVAGDGPLAAVVRDAASRLPNLHVLGRLKREEVGDLLGRSAFLLLPSTGLENNPMVALEALSRGTPILGSERGGIPELVEGGHGFLFDPSRIDDVREVVLRAWTMDREAWKRISESCISWAREHNEERYIKSIMSLLQ
ncbi:MAG TPA: glycosyltransferase family 4 protein [Fibrobacteria bacterium]|nr:glycosyltransferase family 4 protein [Fibrobacteria bacterium]